MQNKNHNEKLNNIFDECLERLLHGESVQGCLRDYPEFASELEPLLKTALAVQRSTAQIKPREEFRTRARYEFRSALASASKPKSRSFWSFIPRWATVLSIILAISLAGSGTVMAASSSMPDSPLYPVKLATEQVRVRLPASSESKAELYADYMDRRITEIIYMANKGNPIQVAILIKRLDSRLITLAALTQAANTPEATARERGGQSAPALSAEPPAVTLAPTAVSSPTATLTPFPAPAETKPGQTGENTPTPAPSADTFKAAGGTAGTEAVSLSPKSKLKLKIANYALSHPAALKAALERAPESVKPDIARAIAIAASGYERALKTLE